MTLSTNPQMKSKTARLDLPPVREYLHMLVDAGTRLYPWKTIYDMSEHNQEHFIDSVEKVITTSLTQRLSL
jgi:hypothetical protein